MSSINCLIRGDACAFRYLDGFLSTYAICHYRALLYLIMQMLFLSKGSSERFKHKSYNKFIHLYID